MITVRRILRCSVNEEARKLYEITTVKNVNSDSVVNKAESEDLPNHKVKEKYKSIFTKEKTESIWNDFVGLKEQCVIIKYVVDVCFTKDISSWQMLVKRLPVNIHNFCRRYLVMSLANNSSLKRWKISSSGVCLLCGKLQSQLHVFNNCIVASDRYTYRHNSVIKTLCNHLSEKVTHGFLLHADIEGCDNPATLFRPRQQHITATGPQEHSLLHRARPEVVIEIRDGIIVTELTCPFELNARKSREYKETRYKEIQGELLTPKSRFGLILL